MIAWADGSSRGNPGPSGVGLVLKYGDEKIYLNKYIGDYKTNNEAEYEAIIYALEQAIPINTRREDLIIYTDSRTVQGQIARGWKINYDHLRELKNKFSGVRDKADFNVKVEYIKRKNQEANDLAQAITQERMENEGV